MRLSAAIITIAMGVSPSSGVAQASGADSAAVLHLIQQRAEAMRSRSAELQRPSYASGAVWINAFGVRRTGPDSIVAFLGRLYADTGFRESRVIHEAPPELIFVRPDVAIVHEFHAREGQRLANGTVIDRRTHTTFVVTKEGGRWLIRYQYIGDERSRASPH
jgi:uncharacterized protein (TIGR02246 family)